MQISFQGAKGAYSDLACHQLYPDAETFPCLTFDDAFDALKTGATDLAIIPIDNTLAGRVADVHHLLPVSGLHIIDEHFLPIHHCVMSVKGSYLSDLTHVHSHVHALPQCRNFIRDHDLTSIIHADTAGAAEEIAEMNDPTQGAIASSLAAGIYDLQILANGVQDDDSNKTRFIVLSRDPIVIGDDKHVMTSFVFEVKNIPAALYKAMGGFATNGVNMMKLESYVDDKFNAARFYCEVESHQNLPEFKRALDELSHFAKDIKILGTYKMSNLRQKF
jgi:prephenate dehydratase